MCVSIVAIVSVFVCYCTSTYQTRNELVLIIYNIYISMHLTHLTNPLKVHKTCKVFFSGEISIRSAILFCCCSSLYFVPERWDFFVSEWCVNGKEKSKLKWWCCQSFRLTDYSICKMFFDVYTSKFALAFSSSQWIAANQQLLPIK